ncbi:transposase [Streptomyces sp. NPDC058426]|uniref:transposase n=1 Tax=Streptomyces sp. NPDC058426 TaxID=3346493 RepID=UPI003655B30F
MSWTGRDAQSTRSASGRQKRASDGTESDRPRHLGIENTSGHRPERTALVIGHRGRQHARQPGPGTTHPRHPAHPARRAPRRRRPAKLHADKGYNYDHLRRWLRGRGIRHRIARRGVESSQRLGRHRRVVERTVSWLAGFRRLYRRYERKPEHFLAFVGIAATPICRRRLTK